MYHLSQSQQLAVEEILKGNNVFITGPAGSGKSYLLSYLKDKIKNFYLTATTGIAAINIGGITLHSWAGLGIEDVPIEKNIESILSARGSNVRRRLLKTDVLAIDEISMLSMETFDKIDKILRVVRDKNEPFGGIQLILFGDFFQLPPVNSDNFCFESDAWKEANIKTIYLKEIFRQKNERFVELLNNVKYGTITKEDIELLKSRYNLENNDVIKPTILSTHNYIVEKINIEKLNNIVREEEIYEADFQGEKIYVDILRKNCIAREFLTLKIGSQVMMLKNTYQKEGVINGSNGIVVAFSTKKQYPVVRFDNGSEITVKPEMWEISKFNYNTGELEILAVMKQIPLLLSWAITIHKSQGMTLDKVECDLKSSFADGQVYVALSRVRDLSGLYIKSFDINKIKTNKKIIDFYNNL